MSQPLKDTSGKEGIGEDVKDISKWLENNRLKKFRDNFVEYEIEIEDLYTFDEEYMKLCLYTRHDTHWKSVYDSHT